MELSTGILSGYIILNCWGRTNLVSMQLWQSLWWLFPPYLSFSRSTHVVSRWILESEPLVWMMYTKCYFFPHHCISWLWKIIDKRRGCIVQRFFITCHELDKTYLVYGVPSPQRSDPPWRRWKNNSCKLQSAKAPTLVPHGPEAVQALGLCWKEGRTWLDLYVLREVHSMLKTTVMISELWPTRKYIDIMLHWNSCWARCF